MLKLYLQFSLLRKWKKLQLHIWMSLLDGLLIHNWHNKQSSSFLQLSTPTHPLCIFCTCFPRSAVHHFPPTYTLCFSHLALCLLPICSPSTSLKGHYTQVDPPLPEPPNSPPAPLPPSKIINAWSCSSSSSKWLLRCSPLWGRYERMSYIIPQLFRLFHIPHPPRIVTIPPRFSRSSQSSTTSCRVQHLKVEPL